MRRSERMCRQRRRTESIMVRFFLLTLCLLVLPALTQGQNRTQKITRKSTNDTCEHSRSVVAKCFIVRGRLGFYNGAPSARIWIIGTKRLLGVHEDILPDELSSKMTSFGMQAFGDFRVCPLTPEKPGVMQIVCIVSTKNIKYKHANR